MLHPRKGEGEHQKPKKSLKGPQLITATLLFCYPVVCAQAAVAQTPVKPTSSFEKTLPQQPSAALYDPAYKQGPYQSQRTPAFLSPILQGMNPNLNTARFPFTSTPSSEQEYQDLVAKATSKLTEAKSQLTKATTQLATAQALKSKASQTLQQTKATLTSATSNKQTATQTLQQAQDAYTQAQAQLQKAQQDLATSDAALMQQAQITQAALLTLQAAQADLLTATSNLQDAQQDYTQAQAQSQQAQTQSQQALTTYNQATQARQQAAQTVQQAQAAYNNSQIPNPNYQPPTYTTQPTSYQIPDANFQTGAPWIGDGSGQSGQPEVHPGHIHFSYVATEVYQDILISPRQIANYNFTVAIWNQDQNSVNQGPVPDTYGLRIYFYDENNNLIHQNSYTSSAVHSWQDVTLEGNTGTTVPVSRVRIGIYGIDNGFWAGTYGPAANNVRLTLGWITGTTQAATTTGTINVDIGEGGSSTFTAPNGGIFIGSNLRYEAYDNPTCGTNISPQLGTSTLTLDANNAVWGDPCGGWVKHITGTLTYSTAEPQYIKDPALLTIVQQAQAEYDSALQVEAAALTSYQQAQQQSITATQESQAASTSNEEAQDEYDAALEDKNAAQATYDAAASQLEINNLDKLEKQTSYEASLKVSQEAGSKVTSAESAITSATQEEQAAQTSYDAALLELTAAEEEIAKSTQAITTAKNDVSSAQQELDSIEPYVEPEPEPEKPTEPEIIELPPLEDLTKVNFEEIKATDLTAAQAEQIKEAALQTFETAEKGSEEYNAALEALLVAAKADDIVVDEALAAIPGVGAAAVAVAEVLNLLSNVGADISPQAREEAQQATVAAVIVGQVAQAAVAATASASITRRP